MVAFVLAGPLVSATSAWWLVMLAVPFLLVYVPSVVRRQRRVFAGVALAGVLTIGAYAAENGLVVAKPPQCEGASWTDADYWIYQCYAFGFSDNQ